MIDYFIIGLIIAIILMAISIKNFPKDTHIAEIIIVFVAIITAWPIALFAATYQILTEE